MKRKVLAKAQPTVLPRSGQVLKIKATVYHVTCDESFYQTEFRTVDGLKKTKLIGREQFRRPTTVVDVLLKAHADLPDDDKEAVRLVKAAVRDRSSKTYRLTNRTGWYGDSFVYLTETFGDLAGQLRHEGASEARGPRGYRPWSVGREQRNTFMHLTRYTLAAGSTQSSYTSIFTRFESNHVIPAECCALTSLPIFTPGETRRHK